MNQDPTSIWAGLCLVLSAVCYMAGYSRCACDELKRKTNRRRQASASYIEKL